MRARRWGALLGAVLANAWLGLDVAPVWGAEAPVATGSAPSSRAGYEEALIAWGLAQSGRVVDPAPEGKRIDGVEVVSEDIVAPSDPYPDLLNLVHAKTRPSVVRQELLLQVGAPYEQLKAEESERNLRKLFVLAIARVVPVVGRTPDAVGVLVVTKDLWSIRLNSQFNTVGPLLQYLRIRPTEQNLFGLNKQLSLDFALRLDTVSLGQAYADPRVAGGFHSLSENVALIFNRTSGALEGSRGTLSFGLPLYALDREWGYGIAFGWVSQRSRVYRGASIWQLPYAAEGEVPTGDVCTGDSPDASRCVPYVYDGRDFSGGASVTRSFGSAVKTQVTGQLGAYARQYTPPAESQLTEAQAAFLVNGYLPRTESAAYAQVSLRQFRARYAVMRDLETFALSEDYQLGQSWVVIARWAQPLWEGGARFAELGASLRYRWKFGDDLLTASAAGAARYVPGASGEGTDGPWVNQRLALEVENVTPFVGIGRFAVRGLVDLKANDLDHRPVLLGGGNGLRGVAAEALSGTQMVLFNVEYRTRPIVFHTLHAGLVLFWDAGSAFERAPALVHTVGIGLRALFPQFDVEPVRIDFGWVLNAAAPPVTDRISASFGQVQGYRPKDFFDIPVR